MPLKMPADLKQEEFGKWSAKLLNEVLASGKLKPGPIKIMPDGLTGIIDGFEYLRSGKAGFPFLRNQIHHLTSTAALQVSGEKIIHRTAETPK